MSFLPLLLLLVEGLLVATSFSTFAFCRVLNVVPVPFEVVDQHCVVGFISCLHRHLVNFGFFRVLEAQLLSLKIDVENLGILGRSLRTLLLSQSLFNRLLDLLFYAIPRIFVRPCWLSRSRALLADFLGRLALIL